jgi:hypothetical protein
LKETDPLGQNNTQQGIFRACFNRARGKEELSHILGCSEKTISNNIPRLKEVIEEDGTYVFLLNYDTTRQPIYTVSFKKQFQVKIKPNMYQHARIAEESYMVINLPDPPKGYDHWELRPLSDLHYGSDTCDYEYLQKEVDYIKATPNVLTMLKGDLIENANKESPADSVFRQMFPPSEQRERLLKTLAPIAHKILYSIRGNHGHRAVKAADMDPEFDISNALDTEYFKGAAYVDIVCGDQKWEIMSIHGKGGSATIGGKVNMLFKKNQFHTADIYTMGHVHDKQAVIDYEWKRNPVTMKMEPRKRSYIICGTFQNYKGSYAEEWFLPPNKAGLPSIKLLCTSKVLGDHTVTND